ncbi:Parapinopsin [Merluccius polli]|uniref:Parapinopsin n=1 Tax=Merluccius polli TaxID=89951 RepID=A0AA47N4V7_MERPO|nr:Parapinopsin [Merluccius polli]
MVLFLYRHLVAEGGGAETPHLAQSNQSDSGQDYVWSSKSQDFEPISSCPPYEVVSADLLLLFQALRCTGRSITPLWARIHPFLHRGRSSSVSERLAALMGVFSAAGVLLNLLVVVVAVRHRQLRQPLSYALVNLMAVCDLGCAAFWVVC